MKREFFKTILLFCAFLPVLSSLQGCAGAVVGTMGTGATVAHDRRTAGTFLDDQIIELKAFNTLYADKEIWSQSHISPTSFNNIVLLSGEVASDSLGKRATKLVGQIPGVRYVYNELVVTTPSSASDRTADSLVTGRIKLQLIHDERIDATRVKIVTERGTVYLMGLITRQEGDLVTGVARRVRGVHRLVKLFEYIPQNDVPKESAVLPESELEPEPEPEPELGLELEKPIKNEPYTDSEPDSDPRVGDAK